MQPTRQELLPHVEVFVKKGIGGHAQLGRHIKYTFTDEFASYAENYDVLRQQCVERAELIFELDDDAVTDTNGHVVTAGIIKDELRKLVYA